MAFSNRVLEDILARHPDVPGISVSLIDNHNIENFFAGSARFQTGELMRADHILECASLSKTVATAFAFEYFRSKNIPISTSVNHLLSECNAPWRLVSAPNCNYLWADEVTIGMLVNHTALGMHYVYGAPLSDETPSPLGLLSGDYEQKYGYKALFVEKKPGSKFSYSGGGFILLQYLIETIEGKDVDTLTRGFLDVCNMSTFSFSPDNQPSYSYAFGHITRTKEVQPTDGGRLKFPPFAAGGLCASRDLARFLSLLARAYEGEEGLPISPETARLMLGEESLVDLGAYVFMRAKVGFGVFVARAGPNKIMLHQAANDGFRGVYIFCFEGPDKGKGAVILSNGDNPGVIVQCELLRLLLSHPTQGLGIRGVDFDRVDREVVGGGVGGGRAFDFSSLKQETIVNIGLRDFVFAAFEDEEADAVMREEKEKTPLKLNSKL